MLEFDAQNPGVWSAAMDGFDTGQLDAEELQEMRAAGFHDVAVEEYGVVEDGDGEEVRGQPPQAHVDAISERVPQVLNDPSIHRELSKFLPRVPFPPPNDFGLGVYLSVLEAIDHMQM